MYSKENNMTEEKLQKLQRIIKKNDSGISVRIFTTDIEYDLSNEYDVHKLINDLGGHPTRF